MKNSKVLVRLGCVFLLTIFLSFGLAIAQNTPKPASELPTLPFELKNGDRVVFVGNSLFENDFQYGYLELALTTRWPDRNVTYRNLGWSGDNVFGVARSTITNPPTGYELLLEHITKAQPTVVFIGYGGIEAEEGEGGLPRFKEGLNKLIDKIDQLGARTILLSPMPILSAGSAQNQTKRNAMLQVYAAAIATTATERSKRFVDLFQPILDAGKTVTLTDNGIHLNETGYYYLATVLEKSLGLSSRTKPVTITVSKTAVETSTPAKMLDTGNSKATLTFTIDEPYLPLPLPPDKTAIPKTEQIIRITGLKKGFYTLTADDLVVTTASARQWETGVSIRQGVAFDQARKLQEMILKKNDLFFFQYRPLNTTYILGFRSYEQGRHVKGLEEQSIIIKWLEGQIAVNRVPKSSVYQLTLLD